MKTISRKITCIDTIVIDMDCIVNNNSQTLQVLNAYLVDITKGLVEVKEISPKEVVVMYHESCMLETTICTTNISFDILQIDIVIA